MLQHNEDSLRSYKRLRPSWKGMVRRTDRLVVNKPDGEIQFVSDGFWLLVNATLPEGVVEAEQARRDRWNQLTVGETTLSPDESLGKSATTLDGSIPATAICVLMEGDKFTTSKYKTELLILRSEVRDTAVNVRLARWVEKWGEDKGEWWVDEDKPHAPLQYAVDGEVVGILMPIYFDDIPYGWGEKYRVGYDKENKRFVRRE